MTKREQNLLNAAQEILSDFDTYGEVLQTDDSLEYGMESPISRLGIAVQPYNEPLTGTPAESRYSRDCGNCKHGICGHKPKPLAQYLAEYVRHEAEHDGLKQEAAEIWIPDRILFEQALDAYESTEQVTIKIERVTE